MPTFSCLGIIYVEHSLKKQILENYFRKKANVLKNTCNTHLNNVKRNSSQQEHFSGELNHWILPFFFFLFAPHNVTHFTLFAVCFSEKYMGGNQQPLCTGNDLAWVVGKGYIRLPLETFYSKQSSHLWSFSPDFQG